MKNFTLCLKMSLFLFVCLVFMSFSQISRLTEETDFIQQLLSVHHNDEDAGKKLKRYELNVTNSGFCRYKRYYARGKTEYFSFNLSKFKDLDYYGTDKRGKLVLSTKGDDVIVQTYNDSAGDVDSMATYMTIPLKDIEPEELMALSESMARVTAQRQAQK
ncbi:MAG: hypothetical protein V4594_24730 [Bacteroidota bacterium]